MDRYMPVSRQASREIKRERGRHMPPKLGYSCHPFQAWVMLGRMVHTEVVGIAAALISDGVSS